MESQIQATVLGVSGRTSRDQKHQMYDVMLSDGNKYTTFDPDVAAQANALQGQAAVANVSVEQNGKWTNFNLLAIGQPGTLVQPTPGLQVGTAIPVGSAPLAQQSGVAGIPMQQPSSGGGGMTDADKARITRLSAVGTAFDFVSRLFAGAGPEAGRQATEIARGLTEAIVAYGHNGTWPGIAASPAQIAAAIQGVQVGVGQQQETSEQLAAVGLQVQAEQRAAEAAQGTDIPWD